jgi:hypothetical protein
MNVIDFNKLEHDVVRKAFHTFWHHALAGRSGKRSGRIWPDRKRSIMTPTPDLAEDRLAEAGQVYAAHAHAGHAHAGHAHDPEHPRAGAPALSSRALSVFRASAIARLAVVAGALVLMWAAVFVAMR